MTFTSFEPANASDLDFVPEARIGAPPSRSRWRKAAKSIALATILGLGAWTALDEASLPRLAWTVARDAIGPFIERHAATPQRHAAAEPLPAIEPALPTPTAPVVAAEEMSPGAAPPSSEPHTADAPPRSPPVAVERPAPLPAPIASDPLQKRALAAGLHPDLSLVLLAKLSDTDYRNAAVAVRTALAETALGGDLIWPRKPAPADAQFKVSLVQGASDCRRYVVMIAKDGWSTTALPLERCGGNRAVIQKK